ncbi:MAG TPA: lytic transglycosylase domain-containing protein [Solirubrobacterales bacterium]|nr:lytic transglycosylase domain-containing protein [Solirubrobacterales bacterium]
MLGASAATIALVIAVLLVFAPGTFDRALNEVTLPLRHEDVIRQQAREKQVDASLIAAVIYSESRFRDQISEADARGLMQVTPQTARHIEARSGGTEFVLSDLSDPDLNIRYGTFYLRELLDLYGENEVAALAAYNAGPTQAELWGGESMASDDITWPETRAYVEEVLAKRSDYRQAYPRELGY